MLKLYEEEMQDVVSLMEQTEMNHPKVNDYLAGLKAVGQLYGKVGVYMGCDIKREEKSNGGRDGRRREEEERG